MQHQNNKKINFVQTVGNLCLLSCEIYKFNILLLDISPFKSQFDPKIESSEQLCSELRLLTSPVLLHRACQIIHKLKLKQKGDARRFSDEQRDFALCGVRPRTSPLEPYDAQEFRTLRSAIQGFALKTHDLLKKVDQNFYAFCQNKHLSAN